jgi:hypothetical protein
MERITQARPKAEWLWLCLCGAAYLVALILAGCGGADAESANGRGNNALAGSGVPGGGTGGGGGEAGGAASSGTGDYGNPDGGIVQYDAGRIDSGFGDNPDDLNCGGTEVEPKVMMETIPGNILLVFDLSGSMDDDYPGTGMKKWQVARDAVLNAISPLQDSVNVGVLFFPINGACDGNNDCCVPPFGTSSQINFLPGPDFIASWNNFWTTTTGVNGSTPTLEALQAASVALTSAAATLTGNTTVVLITDGDPKCGADLVGIDFFSTVEQINAAIATQVAQLTPFPADWLARGITTYVLGLPGPSANALPVLDGIAAAGGTSQHISPTDPAALQSELAKIIGESVTTSFDSCSIGLPHEPPDVNEVVLVVVEGGTEQAVDRDLGTGGGWTIVGSGADMQIVLQGELCNQARAGTYKKISVVFGCVDLPPLEPPEPPM